ncbi:MAG TPA: DNA-processing protein DprA [Chloroflexota bacterium]|nr:DNA-processing protein DprA [Chloroflexota bacterium]
MSQTTGLAAGQTKFFIGLSLLPGIGPVRFGRLVDRLGSAEAAWGASPEALRACGVDEKSLATLLAKRTQIDLNAELERVDRNHVHVLTRDDPAYPAQLRECFNCPAILYVRGNLTPEDSQALAIVGTRRPTVHGRELAQRITPHLVRSGLTIVSGLALGIDTIAHREALQAGGRTIAVLGSGLDVLYPSENRNLAGRVAENGAVISEYAMGTQPDAFNFPARNRIISGLALGTLIVEAGEKSGALLTAGFAVDQNREVFAFPGRISDKQSTGCNRLIKRGHAKLVTGPEDILEELNLEAVPEQLEIDYAAAGANPTERRILGLLSSQPVHVDELGRQTSLATPEVASTLMLLELRGIIRHVGSMHYVLVR